MRLFSGLFHKVRAAEPEVAGAAREIWEGYSDLDLADEPDLKHGTGWMAVRAIGWAAVLSIAVFALYLFSCVYFMFRFYPRTVINGVDVSMMTILEATDAVTSSVGHDVTVTFRSGEAVIPVSELGIQAEITPSIGSLASGQTGYLWAPHAYTCDVDLTYDKLAVLTAVNGVLNAYPEVIPASTPGIAFDSEGMLVYHSGAAAYTRDDAAARDAIANAIQAGAWEIDISGMDCYDRPYAIVPDAALENLAHQWNARVKPGPVFICGGTERSLDAAELSQHVTRSGAAMRINGAWLREVVSGWLDLNGSATGLSVRGVPVSNGAVKAMLEARVRNAAEQVMTSFRAGSSGVVLDGSDMKNWLSSGFVLSLDIDAEWAVLYRDGIAVVSCSALFSHETGQTNDVLAVVPGDGSLLLSNGSRAGGPGCDIELGDFQAVMDALGGSELKCVVSLKQGGKAAVGHSFPSGPVSYEVRFDTEPYQGPIPEGIAVD